MTVRCLTARALAFLVYLAVVALGTTACAEAVGVRRVAPGVDDLRAYIASLPQCDGQIDSMDPHVGQLTRIPFLPLTISLPEGFRLGEEPRHSGQVQEVVLEPGTEMAITITNAGQFHVAAVGGTAQAWEGTCHLLVGDIPAFVSLLVLTNTDGPTYVATVNAPLTVDSWLGIGIRSTTESGRAVALAIVTSINTRIVPSSL